MRLKDSLTTNITSEETLGADVANPDVLIGDKPVKRLENPKDKKKRKKYKKYLIVKRDDE